MLQKPNSPLKKLRKGLGISQLELAKAAGVSQSHISDIECGFSQVYGKLSDFLKSIGFDIKTLEQNQILYMKERHEQLGAKLKNHKQ